MVDAADTIIDGLVGREGQYSNNPNDAGGETMWGITEHVARAYGYMGAMIDLPRAEAVLIYKQRYWLVPKINVIYGIDNALGVKLLDIGVNMGPATGIIFLQRALNVLNQEQKAFPDMTVDGNFGPILARCLNSFIGQRGVAGRKLLLFMVAAQQGVRYIELAERKTSNEQFEYGWELNRAMFGI